MRACLALIALLSGCAVPIVSDSAPDAGLSDSGSSFLDSGLSDVDSGDSRLDASDLGISDAPYDAGAFDVPPVDTGPSDSGADDVSSGTDAGFVFDAAPVDTGASLHPSLPTPPASNTPCTIPGTRFDCPALQVCRFFSPTEGRCESCTNCGNLGDACTTSEECDILFMCFQNACTNICERGSINCGEVGACLDIGHPTHGVCRL